MSYTKAIAFDEVLQETSRFAKALSHPARLAIILHLARKGVCISGDIAEEFPQLSRTTVSQHLQELKSLGLIRGEIDGVRICYCLDPEIISRMRDLFVAFLKEAQTEPTCDC